MCKLIHYIWFGSKPLPKKVKQCIESWKRYFPGWEIKRWDESNFDVNSNLYIRQAYSAKKWAFVSDYARFKILDDYGGIYFDTDVEVVRDFSPLLDLDAFCGFETETEVNPGLVLYTQKPGQYIIHETCMWYENARFLDENGQRIRINVCGIFKSILKQYGFQPNNQRQTCAGMTIFPSDYFCPFDDATGILHKTENTYSIHWYDKSWMPWHRIVRNRCTRMLHRWFGKDLRDKLHL